MRKSIITAILILCCLPFMAQDYNTDVSYEIKGKCPDNVTTVNILDLKDFKKVINSTEAKNGKFEIKGVNKKDAFLGISCNGQSDYTTFINDGTPITADLTNMKIKGSELNEKLNKYTRELHDITKKAEDISKYMDMYKEEKAKGKTDEELKPLSLKIGKILDNSQKYYSRQKEIVQDNLDNIIPAFILADDAMYLYTIPELKNLFKPEYAYTKHPMAEKIKTYLFEQEEKQSLIGIQFKDIEIMGADGNKHKLSEYCGKGRYVLIDFWASWCGPCLGDMPSLKTNYEKYHPKGFDIVAISLDADEKAWKNCIEENKMTWTNLSDLQGWKSEAVALYKVKSVPMNFLVDPQGKIIECDIRNDFLTYKLQEIFGF